MKGRLTRMPRDSQESQRCRQQGFSLIEVLISLILVGITFTGIFATYTTSRVIQNDIDERAKALFMTQKKLEEVATIYYDDLEPGSTIDIYSDELSTDLWLITSVEEMADPEISALWTRFPDTEPNAAYKVITVQALWGDTSGTGETEDMMLSWIRVKRENTVEFYERASSQMP